MALVRAGREGEVGEVGRARGVLVPALRVEAQGVGPVAAVAVRAPGAHAHHVAPGDDRAALAELVVRGHLAEEAPHGREHAHRLVDDLDRVRQRRDVVHRHGAAAEHGVELRWNLASTSGDWASRCSVQVNSACSWSAPKYILNVARTCSSDVIEPGSSARRTSWVRKSTRPLSGRRAVAAAALGHHQRDQRVQLALGLLRLLALRQRPVPARRAERQDEPGERLRRRARAPPGCPARRRGRCP